MLQCLDVKLSQSSPGDDGWKVFSLEYKVKAPLNTILTAEAMEKYLKIFGFLWKMKRVEYVLGSMWKQQMGSKKMLGNVGELEGELRRANLVRHEMLLFVANLGNYAMVEVIEAHWKTFLDEVKKATNLDELIATHGRMVDTILEKVLLTSKNESICKHLFKLFDLILRFKHSYDVLYTTAIEEHHKKAFNSLVVFSVMV